MNLGATKQDDVVQGLRRQLFVGEPGAAPGIAEFKGTGDLRGWLRVTATRAALKLLRKEKREVLTDDDALLARSAAAAADPELLYVKEVYRAQFRAAFQAALDSLTDREKNLMRQHIVDRLTVDDLGALYQVHRATVARWLQKARDTLLVRTRKNFMQDARVDRSECESIMQMVQSQLDGTIRRRLEDV
jgi:RNA polymerase sigma-70 factor (ECF subfamily)